MRDMSDINIDGWGAGGGGRNDLLPCINADHIVGVRVQWWRSLRLWSLVRGEEIKYKVSECNHKKYLELIQLLTDFWGGGIGEGGGCWECIYFVRRRVTRQAQWGPNSWKLKYNSKY